jgi:hypothetical protein
MRYETQVDHSANTICYKCFPSSWDLLVGIIRHPIIFIRFLLHRDRVVE